MKDRAPGFNVEFIKPFISSEAGDAAVEANIASAREVLTFFPEPTTPARTVQLILGQVQAGKTMAILSTIALAADNGYRLFVVLTSDNTWLYGQTYSRLAKALPGLSVPEDYDAALLSADEVRDRGIVLVCTKNGDRLAQLVEELAAAGLDLPAIIIDDEADQASLDTNARRADLDASRINSLITDLRNLFTTCVLLQVTATPNALFLQPEGHDHRPQSVVVLEPGPAYVGGSILFAQDSRHVQDVDLQELLDFLNGVKGMPTGFKRALASFLVAATIRRVYSTSAYPYYFLCHVSHLKDRHDQMAAAVETYLQSVAIALSPAGGNATVLDELEAEYTDLTKNDPAPLPFAKVKEYLGKFITSRDVQVINADSEAREPRDNRIYNFLIGGNRLGRGVTIKRLLTTYYARAVKRPQMDTMQQHARMYGYRREDLDLIRIFTPRDMAEQFRMMAQSDQALRALIRTGEYAGIENIVAPLTMRTTRGNVLAGTIDRYVAGATYVPFYPKYKAAEVNAATARLDTLLANINPKNERGAGMIEVSTDQLIEIITHCQSYSGLGGAWDDERIAAALASLKQRYPKAYVWAIRGQSLTERTERLHEVGSKQERDLARPDGPTLWMYHQNGTGWDGVPFWIPRLRFPNGNFSVTFNTDTV